MKKQKNTKIKRLLSIIEAKISDGQSHGEIAKELSLERNRLIQNLLRCEYRKTA